ncbi:MAG: histidine phosphatase family protein [Actinobacteria bacterium]|nr:histidine phosphatase family protein [Actinomycetota bacterium]
MEGSPPDVWVVRHGATAWSDAGRHTGRTDVPLTPEGQQQAAALVKALDRQRYARVLVSPLGRARETARLAGFADATIDDDLLEWDYGEYEGLTIAEIREHDPGWTIWTGSVPGGESVGDVAARARRVLARTSDADGRVLCFAHGHVLRVLTACCLGLPPEAGAQLALETAGIGVIGHEHDYRTLRHWNLPRA